MQATFRLDRMDHQPTIELDLSSWPSAGWTSRILAELSRLGPDQGLVVRSQEDPTALLCALQSERRDLFDWYLLEAGPEVYRLEIWRRPDLTRRTVAEFMDKDHRRLEELASELDWLVGQRIFPRALERLRHLRVGVSRHVGMEERILYPEYQRIHGAGAGLVHSLESEHSILLRLLGEIERALMVQDQEGSKLALSDLRAILVPHGRNETAWIYPVIDIATARDATGLVRVMQAL